MDNLTKSLSGLTKALWGMCGNNNNCVVWFLYLVCSKMFKWREKLKMYELLKEFIKPELLIIIPALYIVGVGLKKISLFPNRFIPLILGASSVVLCILYILATSITFDWQSVLLGCVYGYCTRHTLCQVQACMLIR